MNVLLTILQDLELDGPVRSLSPSPQVPQISLDILSDADTQHSNIAKMVAEKDLDSLHRFGGVEGIANALGTDLKKGIPGDAQDLQSRRLASQISQALSAPETFFQCLLKACNNYMIVLLLVSLVLSLSYWIKKEGLETGWYEGFFILVAIIIVVVCHTIRDFWHETQCKLSEKENFNMAETLVQVLRWGSQWKLPISDLVMGDIVVLKRGYQVPADGLSVSDEVLELDGHFESIHSQNPFMFYGAKVISGNGRMLVTAAGMNTEWGKRMSKEMQAPNKTPLQSQLDKLYARVDIIGLLISILILAELFLRLKLEKEDDNPGLPPFKGKPSTVKDLVDAVKRIVAKPTGKISLFTTSLNMLLVGISEGYPLVITLSLSYWNKRTLSRKGIAQGLLACATMGSITTICTDKIGGLTLSTVQVKRCRIGEEDINDDSVIDQAVLDALCDGIYTPVLDTQHAKSSEEEGVLSWAALKLGMKQDLLKQSCTLVKTKELNSNEERSLVLERKNPQNETVTCLHWKGPATTILGRCSSYYDSKGGINEMEEKKMESFKNFIEQMQSKHLKTIAFAYKKSNDSSEENNLILIGLLSLKDTNCTETKEAVEACRNGGVSVILVSRDNDQTLRAIADQCGMLGPNPLVLNGKDFRDYTKEERMDKVDQISIMSNASPSDKLLFLECLKQKGHTVAFIGTRTDETPAIKQSDVGVTIGTWSTKMAKGASDIVILDGDFSFLEIIIRHGRCANENIQKYIQHELTMVISGLLISSITTGLLGDAPVTAIQLAFGSVIAGIPGGLALLAEPPAEKLTGRQPLGRGGKLITMAMWRNIIIQTIYQVTILVTIQFKGKNDFLGISPRVNKSLVFNSFVLCQVFNLFNCRKLEKKNIFEGINKNHWFLVAVVVIIGLQAAFIEIEHWVGGSARLNDKQWGICFLIGMVSWVLDCIGKIASDLITHCIGSISR